MSVSAIVLFLVIKVMWRYLMPRVDSKALAVATKSPECGLCFDLKPKVEDMVLIWGLFHVVSCVSIALPMFTMLFLTELLTVIRTAQFVSVRSSLGCLSMEATSPSTPFSSRAYLQRHYGFSLQPCSSRAFMSSPHGNVVV